MKSSFFDSVADSLFELVPDIGEQLGRLDSDLDENYPHIAKNIIFLWGSIECLEYIESLKEWEPTPGRPERQGFPLHVLKEIDVVYNYHKQKFPYMLTDRGKSNSCIWNNLDK